MRSFYREKTLLRRIRRTKPPHHLSFLRGVSRYGYARPNHLKSPQIFKRGIEIWIRQTKPPQITSTFQEGYRDMDTPDQTTSSPQLFKRGIEIWIRQTKPPQITSTFQEGYRDMDTPDQTTSNHLNFSRGVSRYGYARPNHLKSPQLFKRGIEILIRQTKPPQITSTFQEGYRNMDTPDQTTSNHLSFSRRVSRWIREINFLRLIAISIPGVAVL